MNSLSWLLYLAGVFHALNVIAIVSIIFFGMISAIFLVNYFISVNETYDKKYASNSGLFLKFFIISFVFLLTSLITVTIVPNRQTVLLIAASEIGEKFLANDKVSKIIDPSVEYLQKYIEKELKNLKKQIEN